MTGPAFGEVYEMPHALVLVEVLYCVNVQELELELEVKVPPAPPSLHDTVPVGILFVPELESRTFTLKSITSPIVGAAVFCKIVSLVARKVTVSVDVPELVL